MNIAFLGFGKYGGAIGSLLTTNKLKYEYAEIGKPLTAVADIVFVTVPTKFIRTAIENNKQFIDKRTIVINCSKGIEELSSKLPFDIINEIIEYKNYFSLYGPTFANELSDKEPSVISLGYDKNIDVSKIQKILETPYCHVVPTPEFQSVELAGAMKNVYAILCGYADGLEFKSNTHARLILGALQEIKSLAYGLGYSMVDTSIPAITGDVVLTCSSKTSRNYTYGRNLALHDDTNPHEGPVTTVEGYHTSKSISLLSKTTGVSLPLANIVARLVEGEDFSKSQFTALLESSGH